MKRWLLRAGVPLVLVTAGCGWWLAQAARRELTPESLVRRLEAAYHCRASIGTVSAQVFPGPAQLELSDIVLVPRDAVADAGTPLAQRPPIDLHTTYVRATSATLRADLWAILRGELKINNLTLRNLDVKGDIQKGGSNSLNQLFGKNTPTGTPGHAALARTEAPAPAPEISANVPPSAEAAQPTFRAQDLGLSAALDRVAIENGRIRLRNQKTKAVLELAAFHVAVTDLAVDPQNLATRNHATVTLGTRFYVTSHQREGYRYCDLGLQAHGQIAPFDPVTGGLNPNLMLDLTLAQGSSIQGLPVLEKLQKNIEKAQQAGLKLRDLSAKTELQTPVLIPLSLRDHRVTLRSGVEFPFNDYRLVLGLGSFLDAADETHHFQATVLASDQLSQEALGGAEKFLGQLGPAAAEPLRRIFVTPLVRDGKIALAFESQGPTSKPQVSTPLVEDMKSELKRTGADLLQGLLNKALDKQ
jgi:hypothetical protein